MSASRKLDGLQSLRGVAAMMVVMRHLHLEFLKSIPAFHLPAPIQRIFDAGQNGVDLFFVISGFVMVYSSRRNFGQKDYPIEFMSRRIARVVPVYWLYTTVYIAVMLVVQSPAAGLSRAPSYLAASYFFFPMINPGTGALEPVYGLGWTLNYEMYFYVLFALVAWLSQSRAVLALSLIFAVIAAAGQSAAPPIGPLWFWSRPIILEFLAGALVAHFLGSDRTFQPGLRVFFATAAIVLWLGAALLNLSLTSLSLVLVAATLMVVAMTSGPINLSRPIGRIFLLMGDASYSIYLCHMFIVRGASLVTRSVHGTYAHAIAMAAIVLIVTPAVAIASFHLLERPMTRLGYRLSRWEASRRPG